MINEKLFPQYVIECRDRRTAPKFPVAAQIVVADPDGHSIVTLWFAFDLCLRVWGLDVHLHSFLKQPKGIFPPQGLLPWLDPYLAAGASLGHALPFRDSSQG
jgi:hypothetical protein